MRDAEGPAEGVAAMLALLLEAIGRYASTAKLEVCSWDRCGDRFFDEVAVAAWCEAFLWLRWKEVEELADWWELAIACN